MKGTAALASVQGTPRPCIYIQCSIHPQTSDVTLQGITKDFWSQSFEVSHTNLYSRFAGPIQYAHHKKHCSPFVNNLYSSRLPNFHRITCYNTYVHDKIHFLFDSMLTAHTESWLNAVASNQASLPHPPPIHVQRYMLSKHKN